MINIITIDAIAAMQLFISHIMMCTCIGHGLVVRQFRQNSECNVLEELQPIDENRRYDFNFQQATRLPKEIKILPVRTYGIYPSCFILPLITWYSIQSN